MRTLRALMYLIACSVISLLLIDDEEKLRKLLARMLQLEGYVVFQAATAQAAWQVLEKEPIQIVLSDVRLPDANGVELTQKLKTTWPHLQIIVLTAYGTISDGVRAIQNGAFDYLTKGDDNERILPLVNRASEKIQLEQKVRRLEQKLNQQHGFEAILGQSAAIRQALHLAQKVAPTDTTVLLLGETGTGKEVFAQAIHYESPRKTRSFVAVNCSTFGKDILESELFGHRAGAFTGATKDKKGWMEEAHEGTLFLDEIGEMNLDLQAKLLRAIETGEFYRVGETKPRKVNVRFIAATNRNLLTESENGHFRLDLYYRLSVFQMVLPPLRQRQEDIELLAEHFLKRFSEKTNKKIRSLSPDFVDRLKTHPWKGNIRELKNILERAVILADTDQLRLQDLPFELQHPQSLPSGLLWSLQEVEKRHIAQVVHYTQGNKPEAARLLGIGLTTLYRKLQEYGLE